MWSLRRNRKTPGRVGDKETEQIYYKCQSVEARLGVKVASLLDTLPHIRRLLENRRLTHKQEQQETCGQWEEDSVGAGQEVLVDDMLAVNEWLAPRARALVSIVHLTQLPNPKGKPSHLPVFKGPEPIGSTGY